MNDAFYIAATGMQAQQLNLDTIANNVANMNTIGYKRGVVAFSDLVRSEVAAADVASASPPSSSQAASQRLAAGVGIAGVGRQFDTGDLKRTGAPLDVAIQGDGFLEVTLADGSRGYTRGGSLKVAIDGELVTQQGYAVQPGITIPSGAQDIVIGSDGRVQLTVPGRQGTLEVGQIDLVRFADPGKLAVQGDNLYRATPESGEPIAGKSGEDGMGTLVQGTLESSNVKLIDEVVNMMVAQRAYEASVKALQAADELSGMVNNLRR